MQIIKLSLTLALFTALSAFADPTPREVCLAAQLESLNEETPSVRITYRRDIKAMSNEQLERLPLQTKQHVIIVAKAAYAEGYEPRDGWNGRWGRASDLSTTTEAVEYIRQINENRDEELLYSYLKAANGMRFRRVTYYPGALVGQIYHEGTLVKVADINDQDVTCVQ